MTTELTCSVCRAEGPPETHYVDRKRRTGRTADCARCRLATVKRYQQRKRGLGEKKSSRSLHTYEVVESQPPVIAALAPLGLQFPYRGVPRLRRLFSSLSFAISSTLRIANAAFTAPCRMDSFANASASVVTPPIFLTSRIAAECGNAACAR